MQGFLHNVKEKAQASGLMKPVPGSSAEGAEGYHASGSPTSDGAEGKTGSGSGFVAQLSQNPQLAQLNNQLRSFQHHYVSGSSGPALKGLQIGITANKGIALTHDTLSTNLLTLHKELDSWVKNLPQGDVVAVVDEGSVGGGAGHGVGGGDGFAKGAAMGGASGGAVGGLYDHPATPSLLNLTTQLSSLHKVLSTKLLDSRVSLKGLREVEVGLNEKVVKLRDLEKRSLRKPSSSESESAIEQLQAEIHELSYGLGEKREEGFVAGQRGVWEAYGEFARNLLILSHAGTTLTDLYSTSHKPSILPTPANTAATTTANTNLSKTSSRTGKDLTQGEQKERVRAVEEGVRRGLGGLEGGWKAGEVDEGRGGAVGGSASRSSGHNTPGSIPIPPTIPTHVVQSDSRPVQADIIGAYPSSHLNNEPAPIPVLSPGAVSPGGGLGGHRHRSSFDVPITSHQGQGLHSGDSHTQGQSHLSPGLNDPYHSNNDLRTTSSNDPIPEDAFANHPTVAETGMPISAGASGPGPASGQFERREKSDEKGIVRLSSLGGGGIAGVGGEQLPGYEQGHAAPPPAEKSGHSGSAFGATPASSATANSDLPPPPQHPAMVVGTTGASATAGLTAGMSPREQAEYQLRQKGYQGQ